MNVPHWLDTVAWISLGLAAFCGVVIIVDLLRRPQHMWIMNIVWPLTALYSGPLGLIGYFAVGRKMSHQAMQAKQRKPPEQRTEKPFWQTVAVGATHCGSGCTLGDVVAEVLTLTFPVILSWLGLHTLWNERAFSVWILDYVLALLFGVAFQYFSIVPMRHLSPGKGLVAAFKADVLSLTAWQLGMYGWMAIALFAIFTPQQLRSTTPAFWLMMQLAMLAGFLTSYPVNWWLLRSGLKEKM